MEFASAKWRALRRAGLGAAACALLAGTPAAAAQKSITFSYCCEQQDRFQYFTEMAKRYETQHPDVHVEVLPNVDGSKLKTLIAGGEAPDVIWQGFSWYALKEIYQPVDAFLKATPGFTTDLDPNIRRMFELDGKTYGLPLGVATRTIAYNEDLLESAGIPAPTPDWTWDDLLSTAKRISNDVNGDGVPDVYGLSFYWLPWGLIAYGGPHFSEDGKLIAFENKQAAIDAWQIHIDTWSGTNGLAPSQDQVQTFANGKMAFLDVGVFDIPNLRSTMKGTWGVQTFPWLDEGGGNRYRSTWATGEAFMIYKDSKVPDLAFDFVKFILEPDQMKELVASAAVVPSSRTLQSSALFLRPDEMPHNMKAFVESTAFGSSPFAGAGEPVAWGPALQIFNEAPSGKESAQSYMNKMLTAVNGALAAQP